MRSCFFLVFFALAQSINVCAQKVTLAEVRDEFYKSTLDYKYAFPLIEKLKKVNDPAPLFTAYKAATLAILAKPGWNFFKKMSYLKASKRDFEDAIDRDELDVEIRFLRLSVEHHLPKYLGLSKHIQEDKKVIMEKITGFSKKKLSPEVADYIVTFSIESGIYSQEEIARIKEMLM